MTGKKSDDTSANPAEVDDQSLDEISGGPHFQTFDGLTHHLQGSTNFNVPSGSDAPETAPTTTSTSGLSGRLYKIED